MSPRLTLFLLGTLVGFSMELSNRAQAQEIGSGSQSDSGPPTIGTTAGTGSTTPLAPSPSPPPLPPENISAIFSPASPFGGSNSQTGETMAELLRQNATNQSYNLKVGPIQLRAAAQLTATFNDNVGLSQHHRISDIIVTPLATLNSSIQVSQINAITLNLGIGYQAYLLNPKYDSIILTPDSVLNFNFFLGDVAIGLHDFFSYQQDPTQYGQLSNQVRLRSFNNDAGVSASWDLGDYSLELDYDHANLWVLDSIYDYLTNQSDTFAPSLTYKLDETISVGLNGSLSDTRYEQSFENDNVSESFGPFVKATLTNNLSATAAAGLFFTQYSNGGSNGDNSDVASYYANFGVTHRINDVLTESLTGGKQYLPGLTSNYTERLYLSYNDSWNATQNISFNSSIFWQNLSDSDATFRENSNNYGVSLGAGDSLSRSLSLYLSYQFLLKEATPSYLSYNQSQATVGMNYNF